MSATQNGTRLTFQTNAKFQLHGAVTWHDAAGTKGPCFVLTGAMWKTWLILLAGAGAVGLWRARDAGPGTHVLILSVLAFVLVVGEGLTLLWLRGKLAAVVAAAEHHRKVS